MIVPDIYITYPNIKRRDDLLLNFFKEEFVGLTKFKDNNFNGRLVNSKVRLRVQYVHYGDECEVSFFVDSNLTDETICKSLALFLKRSVELSSDSYISLVGDWSANKLFLQEIDLLKVKIQND